MVLFLFRVAVESAEEFCLCETIYASFGSPANHFFIECFVLRDLFSGDSLEKCYHLLFGDNSRGRVLVLGK